MKFKDVELELINLRPTKDNVIVIKILDELDVDEAIKMSEFINEVLQRVCPDTKAVMISNKVELGEVSEEQMNNMGWYRKQDSNDILGGLFE